MTSELDERGCEFGRMLRRDFEHLAADIGEMKGDLKTLLKRSDQNGRTPPKTDTRFWASIVAVGASIVALAMVIAQAMR